MERTSCAMTMSRKIEKRLPKAKRLFVCGNEGMGMKSTKWRDEKYEMAESVGAGDDDVASDDG